MTRLSFVLIPALLLAATAARAEDCRTDGGPLPDLPRATVIVPKTHFIKGTCADDPSAKGCTRKAYLVDGDTVFLGPVKGALQCVGYLGRGGGYTEGWIAADALQRW